MKKIISALLGVSFFMTGAYAKEWVSISGWAYNDVSIFTDLGLLPESFGEITDYTQNITRGQFAELLFTAVNSKHSLIDMLYVGYDNNENPIYGDYTEYLKLLGIMEGMPDGNFYHELPITREDAAVSIYRTIRSFGFYFDSEFKDTPLDVELYDKDEISDYASDAVKSLYTCGLIKGTGEKTFSPKSNITIEQSIILINRLYNIWKTPDMTDGYNILSGGETKIKTFENGFEEYKNAELNKFLIKKENICLEFETDIYSNILCGRAGDGKDYICAVTYNGSSDVYNTSGELLFIIPYKVHSLDENYIYVTDNGRYGLYSYDGREIIPPLYSMYETELIIQNNLNVPEYEYREPDGIIYFTDKNTGNLYSIDSNGENTKVLDRENCSNIAYYKGMLYYSTDNGLVARYPDGIKIIITDKKAIMCSNGKTPDLGLNTFKEKNAYEFPELGGYLFFVEMTDEYSGNLYRFSIGDKSVDIRLIQNNVHFKDGSPANPHVYNGYLYYSVTDDKNNMRLMRMPETFVPENVSGDMEVFNYGFTEDKIIIERIEGEFYCSELDAIDFKKTDEIVKKSDNITDEQYKAFKQISGLYYVADDGIEQFVSEFPYSYQINGDYLYYAESTDEMFIQEIFMVNMKTGIKKQIGTVEMNQFLHVEGVDCVIYEALNSQLWRIDEDKISQIYPNNGIDRYDTGVYFRRVGEDLVKIGKNGSCTLIAEDVSHQGWIYVENGSDTVSADRNF